jgi:hypothetical protein
MTVTLAQRSSGGGGGPGWTHPCGKCGTRYEVDIEPVERIRIDIVGSTCRECNPKLQREALAPLSLAPSPRPASPRPASPKPAQVVKVSWRPSFPGDAALEILRVDNTSRAAERWPKPTEAVPAGQPGLTTRIDPAGELRAAVAVALAGTLGDDVQQRIEAAWRPAYCQMLVKQAQAIDAVATMDRCDDSTNRLRLLVRLVDAPPLVAALTVEVFARLLQRPIRGLLWDAAYAMEAVGTLLCCSGNYLDECVAAGRVAALWGEAELSADRLSRVLDRWFKPVLGARADLPQYGEIFDALAAKGDALQIGEIRVRERLELAGVDKHASAVAQRAVHRGPMIFGDSG